MNSVYLIAKDLGKKLFDDQGNETPYSILYGLARLVSMDETSLQVLFPEGLDREEIASVRRLFEQWNLDIDLLKTGSVYIAPFFREDYKDREQFLEELEALKKNSDAGIDSFMQLAVNNGSDFLKLFEKDHTIQDIFDYINLHKAEKDTAKEKRAKEKRCAEPQSSTADTAEKSGDDIERKAAEGRKGEKKLERLAAKYSELSAALLDKVKGQETVIKEFVQGCCQGEILDIADDRDVPSAIFLFVGPPGVGKTLLAQTAAKKLGRPYKIFNMSEYSGYQSADELIGTSKIYSNSREGLLVKYVREHPDAILIFDEIEKAHSNVINLFLQILDRGCATNANRDEEVSFKHCMIIFTSNVGKSLYENNSNQLSNYPKKVIMDAIARDIDPRTGERMLSEAICSRMAAGNVLMFNHLTTRTLVELAKDNFTRAADKVQEEYGLNVQLDPLMPLLFLYNIGGNVDARIVGTQSGNFIKKEIYEIVRQTENNKELLKDVENLRFIVERSGMSENIRKLFVNQERTKILVLCRKMDEVLFDIQNRELELLFAGDAQKAKQLITQDVSMVLIDPYAGVYHTEWQGVGLDDLDSEGIRFFNQMMDKKTGIPVYLIEAEKPLSNVDRENFSQMGAAGIVPLERKHPEFVSRQLQQLAEEIFMERESRNFSRKGNVLEYNSSQQLSEDGKTLTVFLYDIKQKQAIDVDSRGAILDEASRPSTKFPDIIGAKNAKEELQYFIGYLKNPKKFLMDGGKPPKGILLYGPPGTGKTTLARAMAGESDVAFLQTSATEFKAMYVGQSEKNIRDLFAKARRYAPAIIFIDEIDAIGKARTGDTVTQHTESMLNTLLTEMDGFQQDHEHPVFVLAATNYMVREKSNDGKAPLDPALLRRFDNKIYVDLPDRDERREYLSVAMNKLKKGCNCNVEADILDNIADRSTGQSIANLQNIVDLAFRNAQKRGEAVTGADLLEAMEEYNYGEKRLWEKEYYETVAIHESGHAFLSFISGEVPSFVTIVSRGDFGGYMQHANQENKPSYSREEIRWQIRIALAGRAAEQEFFGEEKALNTGAQGDLRQATRLALNMLCNYGMNENQLICFDVDDILKTSLAVDYVAQANQLLQREMEETLRIVRRGRDSIRRLADRLLEKNQLSGREIEKILKQAES